VKGLHRFNRAILNNWQLKLLAVALGALTFYAVWGRTSFEVHYDIPLQVAVEKGMAVLSQPKTVLVTFRGSQGDLGRLDPKQMKAVVRPRVTDTAVSETVHIDPGNVVGAPGVRVVKVDPSVVTLSFDREIEKIFEVAKPKTIGTPLIGKVEVDYEPKMVRVRGSQQRLKDKNMVTTEPVNVSERVESFSKRVRVLSPVDSGVSEIEPDEVTVHVKIATESITKAWTNVVVVAMVKPAVREEFHVEPDAVTVTFQGRAEALEHIAEESFQVFVDCRELEPAGRYELPVQLHLPVDVDAAVDPETVRVIFK